MTFPPQEREPSKRGAICVREFGGETRARIRSMDVVGAGCRLLHAENLGTGVLAWDKVASFSDGLSGAGEPVRAQPASGGTALARASVPRGASCRKRGLARAPDELSTDSEPHDGPAGSASPRSFRTTGARGTVLSCLALCTHVTAFLSDDLP